jgi:hypothetical protein
MYVAVALVGHLRAHLARQTRDEIPHDADRVDELSLGIARMYAETLNRHGRAVCIEGFVLDLAQRSAIHGIGELRAKALHVELVGAATDLFVGVEAHFSHCRAGCPF